MDDKDDDDDDDLEVPTIFPILNTRGNLGAFDLDREPVAVTVVVVVVVAPDGFLGTCLPLIFVLALDVAAGGGGGVSPLFLAAFSAFFCNFFS